MYILKPCTCLVNKSNFHKINNDSFSQLNMIYTLGIKCIAHC